MATNQELESQIATLKAELDRLRSGMTLMTLGGTKTLSPSASGSGDKFTIQGLEEMILIIDRQGSITYLNDRMAQLLGITPTERSQILRSPLSALGTHPVTEVINSLYGAIRESGENYIVEREFPDLGADRLPSLAARKVKDIPLLRFVCAVAKGQIQIVANDVTHTHWLEKNFSRYVSPRVMEQMQTIPEDELMRTEKREATVLFADLSGFTRACQELPPEGVVEMVNSFLTRSVAAVERYDGMVDKFVGDEIMAIFGVPLPTNDHALRALIAADMIMKTHEKWVEQRKAEKLVAPGVHIGVASGELIVGNIGTPARVDYTVLGHTVNLAARLCGEATAGEICTIRATHNSAREGLKFYKGLDPVPRFHFNPRGTIELKNILKPVEIIAVTT